MNCNCGQEIKTVGIQFECIKLDVCADGYDIDEELWPFTMQPRSGKRKTEYIPGKKVHMAYPCGCQISEKTFNDHRKSKS